MRIKFHADNLQKIGLEIKLARISKGLKQWEMARKIGVCQNTLSLIESGRKYPSSELIETIQKILDET